LFTSVVKGDRNRLLCPNISLLARSHLFHTLFLAPWACAQPAHTRAKHFSWCIKMQSLQFKPASAAHRGCRSSVACRPVAKTSAVTRKAGEAATIASMIAASVVPASQAAEIAQAAAAVDSSSLTLAVGSGAAIAGLGALLVATDPQNRQAQVRNITCYDCLVGCGGTALAWD
jgi:hypothetical protein